jgi:hypothetical protein
MTFRARILIGFSIAGTLSVSGALAQVAGSPAELANEKKKAEAKAAKENGLKVFIDPVTGQIRQPTAAEIGALSEPKTATAQAEPVLIPGPGGGNGVGAMLDESTMMYMVVTKRQDGKLDMDCVTGDKTAANRVANPKPAALKPVLTAPKKEQLDVM